MSSIARIAFGSKTAIRAAAVRNFSVSLAMQKDVVQELYLKELKGYKPAPPSKAEEAQVKELKLPPPPAAPQVDEDLAQQLAAYDAEPEEASQ